MMCFGPSLCVEQCVVYSIYYMDTLVLPEMVRGEGCLTEMIMGENKRCYHIRCMGHGFIYKVHNMTVTAIQHDLSH